MAVPTPMDALLEFFPTGTAEGEQLILERAFVQAEEYVDLMAPPPLSPRLLVGKKGSGKSALVYFYQRLLTTADVPSLLLRPMDIDIKDLPDTAAVGQVTALAYASLVSAVAAKLGQRLKGMLNRVDKRLHDAAVKGGLKDRDLVETMAERLALVARPATKLDFSGLLPGTPAPVVARLEESVAANLARSESTFWMFLDDTDQVAAPEVASHLNRIWGFILAARALAQKSDRFRVVVSLRDEVWRRITRDQAGQRDQTDHFIPLVGHVVPTPEHIAKIVEKRLSLAAERLGVSRTTWPFSEFFEGDAPRMPLSRQESTWEALIVGRSRERPRDAIQLVGACARHVKANARRRIGEDDFSSVMQVFSQERATSLAHEAERECPQLLEIVRSLARLPHSGGAFKTDPDTVRAHFLKLPSEFGIVLYGKKLRPNVEEDAMSIWRMLWDLGVLNARAKDAGAPKGYRHIKPSEDPGLIEKARWNELQALLWEINAAYRDYLLQVKETRRW